MRMPYFFVCLCVVVCGVFSCKKNTHDDVGSAVDTGPSSSNNSDDGASDVVEQKCQDLQNTVIDTTAKDVSSQRFSAVPSRRSNARTEMSFEPNTDFSKDEPVSYGFDASSIAFADINNLLCVLQQTRYLVMAQAGKKAYRAWVDLDQCDQKEASSVRSSGAFREPNLRAWLVEIEGRYCEIGSKPLKVSFWGKKFVNPLQNNRSLADVYGVVQVNGLADAMNPFGVADIEFSYNVPVTRDTSDVFATKASVTSEGSDGYKITYAYVDSLGKEVRSSMVRKKGYFEGSGQVEYRLADNVTRDAEDGLNKTAFVFNDTEFVSASESGSQECGDACVYDMQDYRETVWRMGLYDQNGTRDARQTSMSIVLNYRVGQPREDWIQGWVDADGYHIIGDYNVVVDNIYEEIYEEKPGRRYDNAVHAWGVLKKIEKTQGTLSDLDGWDLLWVTSEGQRFWVRWDNEGGVFRKLAAWNIQSFVWEPSSGVLSFSHETSATVSSGVLMDLQTKDNIVLDASCVAQNGSQFSCVVDSDTVFHKSSYAQVFPDDVVGSLDLYCMHHCPKPASQGGFYPDITRINKTPQQAANEGLLRHYYLNTQDMTLYEFSSGEKISRENKTDEPTVSGNMIASSDLAAAVCADNASETCASSIDTYGHVYEWSTGPVIQYQYYFLREKNGAFIKASPRPEYFHTVVQNQPLFLTYWGYGELEGVPLTCVDLYSRQPVACSNVYARKIPMLNIADGTMLSNQHGSLYVKAIEVEHMYAPLEGNSGVLQPSFGSIENSLQLADALQPKEQPEVPPGEAVVGGVLASDTCTTVGCDNPVGCAGSGGALCDVHAVCDVSAGCVCNEGFTGDGIQCVDVDECAASANMCDPHAACINTQGAFYCACVLGYAGDGFECEDNDECYEGTDRCDPHAVCQNTQPGYTCTCMEGYEGSGETCVDVAPPHAPVVQASAFTNDNTPTWTWNSGGEGNGDFVLVFNNQALGVTRNKSYTPAAPLIDGVYVLGVSEKDDADHVSEATLRQVTVDTVAPDAVEFVSGVSFNTAFPVWEWEASEAEGFRFEVKLDGMPVVLVFPESTLWSPSEALSEGNHTLEVRQLDRAGNVSEPALWQVHIQL